ncbi:MAG: hypothetical protein ABFD92_14270 [Planctomycetaceae bacterium]|nr:hypothetical protein [Planctomycetaceae bacterium]
MNQARMLRNLCAVAIVLGGGLLLAAAAVGISYGRREQGLAIGLAIAGALMLLMVVPIGSVVRSASSCSACGKLIRPGAAPHCPRCGKSSS